MLQRIQTLWLLLAGLAALLTLKLPTYANAKADNTYVELTGLTAGTGVLIVTILVALVAFTAIGIFKNRPLQLKICLGAILLEALLIFLYYRQASETVQGTLAVYAVLHMAIILFFVLAARGISSDEKLIKESDRLR